MPDKRDLPLFAWSDQLRLHRLNRRRLRRRAAALALGGAALCLTIAWPPVPRLVWNVTASAPIGLYHVAPGVAVKTGDMVVAWLPAPAADLAAKRAYLPAGVPAVKRVAAASGSRICAIGDIILLDGATVANRQSNDKAGRPLPRWRGCHTLEYDELFLLTPGSSGSFDGRYFGVSRTSDIVGKARLLWAR